MQFISVCSGIEAASQAWLPLGWKPQFYSEVEKFPSAVLEYRHPDVPNLGDMTKFKEWSDYDADVLVGGTPCQSFSVAGLRKGLDDPRGNLMLTYLAIADRYRPYWLVWENVPGVLSSNQGRDFGTFLGALGKLGYGWSYRVLDAQYFGVPQRRRRVFVVGCLGGWQRAGAVLFERESLQRNPAPSRKEGERIADTLTVGANQYSGFIGEPVTGTLTATYGEQSGQDLMDMKGGLQPVAFTQNDAGRDATEGLAPTLRSGGDGGLPQQCVAFAQNTRNEVREMEVVGALAAQPGMKQQSYLRNGMHVRRLTPVECERLQGFPDNYTRIPWRNKPAELCPDGPRYKALGNSMAVPVMKWIGERIEQVQAIKAA